jgi:hypothetical protein
VDYLTGLCSGLCHVQSLPSLFCDLTFDPQHLGSGIAEPTLIVSHFNSFETTLLYFKTELFLEAEASSNAISLSFIVFSLMPMLS